MMKRPTAQAIEELGQLLSGSNPISPKPTPNSVVGACIGDPSAAVESFRRAVEIKILTIFMRKIIWDSPCFFWAMPAVQFQLSEATFVCDRKILVIEPT